MARRTSRRRSSRKLAANRVVDRTQTAAFQRWFGESKVVDAGGRPMVVYHGHPVHEDAFFAFDRARVLDVGFHFGTAKAAAEFGTVRAFYLSLQNPIHLHDPGDWLKHGWGEDGSVPLLDQLIPRYGIGDREIYEHIARVNAAGAREFQHGRDRLKLRAYRAEASQILADFLLQHGYDGIVYTNREEDVGSTSWIALRPEQIKSATGNNGSFDPHNPDIRRNPQ